MPQYDQFGRGIALAGANIAGGMRRNQAMEQEQQRQMAAQALAMGREAGPNIYTGDLLPQGQEPTIEDYMRGNMQVRERKANTAEDMKLAKRAYKRLRRDQTDILQLKRDFAQARELGSVEDKMLRIQLGQGQETSPAMLKNKEKRKLKLMAIQSEIKQKEAEVEALAGTLEKRYGLNLAALDQDDDIDIPEGAIPGPSPMDLDDQMSQLGPNMRPATLAGMGGSELGPVSPEFGGSGYQPPFAGARGYPEEMFIPEMPHGEPIDPRGDKWKAAKLAGMGY